MWGKCGSGGERKIFPEESREGNQAVGKTTPGRTLCNRGNGINVSNFKIDREVHIRLNG